MKLSELETEKAYDIICELTPHVESIVTDSELIEELQGALNFDEYNTAAEKFAAIAGKFSKLLPIVMKKKKEDVFSIVAIINESDVDAIKKQNLLKTMNQIKDIVQDKELVDFFKSCKNAEGVE